MGFSTLQGVVLFPRGTRMFTTTPDFRKCSWFDTTSYPQPHAPVPHVLSQGPVPDSSQSPASLQDSWHDTISNRWPITRDCHRHCRPGRDSTDIIRHTVRSPNAPMGPRTASRNREQRIGVWAVSLPQGSPGRPPTQQPPEPFCSCQTSPPNRSSNHQSLWQPFLQPPFMPFGP